jgi:predicted dehydrogenase
MCGCLRIGMIGLDTSHVPAFTKLLNDPSSEYHIPGGRVVVAYPGGSPDFELSYSRIAGFTKEIRDQYGVQIVESPEEVAGQCDAVLLESVDGRVHLEQFRRIASFGKPVFIDKPFAVSSEDAKSIMNLARLNSIPIMSASALRFAEGLQQVNRVSDQGAVIGADFYGPMALQQTQPGLFWYGVHTTDMLYQLLGKGCVEVTAITMDDHDVITGVWRDGRIGTIRGNRKGNSTFGGVVHREMKSDFVDVYTHPKPYYASLLEQVMKLFTMGQPAIDPDETLEIVRFMEAANESRLTGKRVSL